MLLVKRGINYVGRASFLYVASMKSYNASALNPKPKQIEITVPENHPTHPGALASPGQQRTNPEPPSVASGFGEKAKNTESTRTGGKCVVVLQEAFNAGPIGHTELIHGFTN